MSVVEIHARMRGSYARGFVGLEELDDLLDENPCLIMVERH
jgi:hypothetical protein